MKKWFWCGAATAVVAAAGVYVAAAYVQGHPDSLAARCATAAYRMGAVCNPVLHAGRGMLEGSEEACETAGATAECPSRCGPVEPEYRGDAEPCEDGYRPLPACAGEEACEFVTRFCQQHRDAGLARGGEEACEHVSVGRPPTCRESESTTRAHPTGSSEKSCCPFSSGCTGPAGAGEEQELLPPPRCVPAKPKPCGGECGKEDRPGCPSPCLKCPLPGVDTTEFRPSDAKKGEFDRIPF
jgi:hypothetical protein